MVVEQLVVAEFVGRDALADLLEHRLVDRVGQGGVVGRGADLDDTAGDQLAAARTAHRGVDIEVDLVVTVAEALARRIHVPVGIGQTRPAPQDHTVLDFLGSPAPGGIDEEFVALEHIGEVTRIVLAVVFDQGRGLDDADRVVIDPGAVEILPGDIFRRPMIHRSILAQTSPAVTFALGHTYVMSPPSGGKQACG